jgi:hypothetical protein
MSIQVPLYMIFGLLAGFIAAIILSIQRYPIWEVRKMIRHTRKKGKEMSEWVHEERLANHSDKIIVKPSCDILYSYTFLDLRSGPYLLSMPPFGRYFSFAFLDVNTDVMAYYTNRDVSEGAPVEVIIARPNDQIPTALHEKKLPRVLVDATLCWIIGRFGLSGPGDVDSTREIQQHIELKAINKG